MTDAHLGDREIAARIAPGLLAAALGLVPFTMYSNFMVQIAEHSGTEAGTLGALRGTGGVAALIAGIVLGPLLDRVSRRAVAAASLGVLAVACLLGAVGSAWAWVPFCLLVGGATALLNPAVSAAASDRFSDQATAGRAATMVSSTMTLTAVLAAPVLAAPALLWGWRGDFVAVAAVSAAGAVALGFSSFGKPTGANPRTSYTKALVKAARIPAVLPLVGLSALRTAAFMGQLAFIAVLYNQVFHLQPGAFSLVWSLSGVSFFLGNWFGGRFIRQVSRHGTLVVVAACAVLVGALAVFVLFWTPLLPVAAAMTSLVAIAHAVIAAVVTTLLVRSSDSARGTVLALNGAAQSLGTFGGASLAGAGYALGGWPGIALVLAGTTLLGVAMCAWTWRAFGTRRVACAE